MNRVNKRMLCALFLIFTLGSCHKKTVPVIAARTEFPDAPKSTKAPMDPAAPEFIAAGKMIYQGRCTNCHDLKEPDIFNNERWTSILKLMIPKAKLNDEQAKQVTAYVMANAKK